MPAKGSGRDRQERILALCDGVRTSHEIAAMVGDNAKYVQATMLKFDAPRLRQAPPTGSRNPSYKHGRRIDRDGYVLVGSGDYHPFARKRAGRSHGLIYEHRLVMEIELGRYLLPTEVVDHIDGLRLHNCPSNLRVFDSNSQHLRATITGRVPQWSEEGKEKLALPSSERWHLPQVHRYAEMKKSGDARLREILLAALQLGSDSKYLLGTSHHLEKAGIYDLSRSNLILELDRIYQRYA